MLLKFRISAIIRVYSMGVHFTLFFETGMVDVKAVGLKYRGRIYGV